MWRSNTAGQRDNTTGCRRWRPIWLPAPRRNRRYPAALAAEAATTTIPIVFLMGTDPIKAGVVTSLNRPEGNITGVSFLVNSLGMKRVELLSQLVPRASTIGMLANPTNPDAESKQETRRPPRRSGENCWW